MKEVLIIHTNAHFARQMKAVLNKAGHTAGWMKHFPNSSVLPARTGHFLTVVDAAAFTDGQSVFLRVLEERGLPVLFISDQEELLRKALRDFHGYADILLFPFGKRAFASKVSEVLHYSRNTLTRGGLTLNAVTGKAMLNGLDIVLTVQEFLLLKVLMLADHKPVSRAEILKKAWGYEYDGATRTVDVHVQRLRRKIGINMIRTVPKVGYCLGAS